MRPSDVLHVLLSMCHARRSRPAAVKWMDTTVSEFDLKSRPGGRHADEHGLIKGKTLFHGIFPTFRLNTVTVKITAHFHIKVTIKQTGKQKL